VSDNRITRRASIGVLFIGLSLAPTMSAQTTQAAARPPIAIENFGRIDDNYYRGGQPEGRDYADLAAFGVKTVIDLQADGDAEEAGLVQAAGMKFLRIPLTTRSRPQPAAVAQFLAWVNDSANQPVFVHCQGGHHRTGVMTAVYRMTKDGWTADRAYEEMQRYGFGPAFLHATLKAFVYDWAAQLPRTAVPVRTVATSGEPTPTPGAADAQLRQ
jgi:tyrosine-protein phosphatase SIW14